jgi:hypothetical protein
MLRAMERRALGLGLGSAWRGVYVCRVFGEQVRSCERVGRVAGSAYEDMAFSQTVHRPSRDVFACASVPICCASGGEAAGGLVAVGLDSGGVSLVAATSPAWEGADVGASAVSWEAHRSMVLDVSWAPAKSPLLVCGKVDRVGEKGS